MAIKPTWWELSFTCTQKAQEHHHTLPVALITDSHFVWVLSLPRCRVDRHNAMWRFDYPFNAVFGVDFVLGVPLRHGGI